MNNDGVIFNTVMKSRTIHSTLKVSLGKQGVIMTEMMNIMLLATYFQDVYFSQADNNNLSSRKISAFFIMLINWFSISPGVGSLKEKKIEKILIPTKISKNGKIFKLKFGRHPIILIPSFSILVIYVTNSSACAS